MNIPAKETIEKIKQWATKNDDIVYALIAGSHGRSEKQSDEYSDIDIIMVSEKAAHYQNTSDWIAEIGESVLYFEDRVSGGIPTKRVYFPNGVGMDIFFVSKKTVARAYRFARAKENKKILFRLIPPSVKRKLERYMNLFSYLIYRGYLSLVDKGNYAQKVACLERVFKYKKESNFRLNEAGVIANKFWYKALHVAVKLHRRELFTAKVDASDTISLLLTLIEMHTKVKKGKDFETWHRGRYIEEWADPFIAEKLNGVFGSYDMAASWKSLFNTMDLFSEIVASIVNERKDVHFLNPEPYVRKWIEDIYAKANVGSISQPLL